MWPRSKALGALIFGTLVVLPMRAGAQDDCETKLEAITPIEQASRERFGGGEAGDLLREAETLAARPGQTKRVAAAYEAVIASASATGDGALESLATGRLARLYLLADRLDDARTLFRRALFRASASDAPELEYRWLWELARIAERRGDRDSALRSLRQSVVALSELGPTTSESPHLRALEPAPAEVFRDMADQLLRRAASSASPEARGSALREVQSVLESAKRRELREYFSDGCLAIQEERSAGDVEGAMVLYPVILEDRLEILVQQGGELSRHVAPVGSEELQAAVARFRRALERRVSYGFRAEAETLYDWIIRPVESELAKLAPDDVLVFVPDGALRTIPMAALRDRDSGRFLIERFPIAVTPAITLTAPRKVDWGRASALVVGISEPRGRFAALPHVSEEVAKIKESFAGTQLLDAAFSRESLERAIGERTFDLVHVASHAGLSSDSGTSFILSHTGPLPLAELAAIVGSTRFRERPLELLVLSACETAAGDERAALGLAGVAVQAGARSAVGSLWSVYDQSSSVFVERFYAGLREGASRARAMQSAQLHLLRETRYRHPAFWSPFILINNWL